jgi:hypothetical protein
MKLMGGTPEDRSGIVLGRDEIFRDPCKDPHPLKPLAPFSHSMGRMGTHRARIIELMDRAISD